MTMENEESYFECILTDGLRIEIAYWSFYEFAIQNDKYLEEHSLGFEDWEKLTHELLELEYDFETKLNQYIQQFSEDEISEFTF